jgi:LysM repeat protein
MSGQKNSLFRRIFPIFFAIFGLLVILGATIFLLRIPAVPTQLSAKSGRIVIVINKPLNGTSWDLGSSIKIYASAVSALPIESLQLWVDGVLDQPSKPTKGNFGAWVWTLSTPGLHTLVVRATDSHGDAANSNVVRVNGLTTSLPGLQVLYLAQPGDTLQVIANKYGVPVDQIKVANPKLNGDLIIPPGNPVKVPIDFPQPAPSIPVNPTAVPTPGPSQAASPNLPNKLVLWGSQFLYSQPPLAPDLALVVNGCSIQLLITSHSTNALGFNIYRLDPNVPAFKKINSIGPESNTASPIQYTDKALFGNFSYYVSSFNGQGESPSNVATAGVSVADCLTPFWSGSQADEPPPTSILRIQTPLPKPAQYDNAYYYLSINGDPHTRVPADPAQFLPLPGGIFDVSVELKKIEAADGPGLLAVDLDAWGWQGGALIHIGDFKRTINPQGNGLPNGPTVSAAGLLQVCEDIPCLGGDVGGSFVDQTIAYKYQLWPFRWMTNSPEVTGGLVQVSISPLDATCDLNPNGLIWSDNIPGSAAAFTPFNVDFAALHTQTVVIGGVNYTDATQFYIRVLPQVNGQTGCPASNSVTWAFQVFVDTSPTAKPTLPPAPQPPNPYLVSITQFNPIQYPDYFYANCETVKVNPYFNGFVPLGYDPIWAKVPEGGWVCPVVHTGGYQAPDQSFFDQLGSWVKQGVNALADAYNSLESFVVDLTDELNPLCIQAKIGADAIGSGQTTVKDVCHAVAEATVDVALTYAGLPPSLPDYSQVVGAGKGYLVDEAAQQFEDQTGLPCDDKCKNVLSQGLDNATAQIAQSQNDQDCVEVPIAEDNGFEPLCAPPGVLTVPDSRGQLLPAFAQIQITRDPNVPDSAFPDPSQYQTKCTWALGVNGANDSLAGKQVFIGTDWQTGNLVYWTGTPLSGELFNSVNGQIPDLAPGDSISIPITLQPKTADYPSQTGFWILEHYQLVDEKQLHEQMVVNSSDDWSKLYLGALASVKATTHCYTTGAGSKGTNSPSNDAGLTVQIPAGN